MIPIYNAPHQSLTPAVQDATRAAMVYLCKKEGWMDSKGIPTPHDGGVIYQDNEMTFVQYVADEGSVEFTKRGPTLRALADRFGYEKSSNCKAMVLECTNSTMLQSRIVRGTEVLSMTDYGWETLARWEYQRELDREIGDVCEVDKGDVMRAVEEWDDGTLFYV